MENKETEQSFLDKSLVWLKARFKEASTWTAIVVVAAYFGITLSSELWEYISGICVSLIGIIQFIKKDN